MNGLLLLGLGLLSGDATDAAPAPPRGVIVIMADDAGAECFGCYGGQSYATPHIDALAASGMRFEHAHAQPLCTPSRVKIMTGRSNVRNYQEFSILRPGETTFAHALGASGRRSAVVGKWQLYGAEHYGARAFLGSRPESAGFDEFRLWQIEELGSRYWEPRWEENGRIATGREDQYGPDVFLDYGLRFLERHRERPFLLYWPSVLPHDPFVPTPHSPDRAAKKGKQHFGPMVEYLDHLVGRLVAELERLGLRDDTLLLFTSDNGTHKSIRSMQHGQEVRGGKSFTTDNGTHVPLIVSWPGVVEPGRSCPDLVDLSDVFPTLCEATGATAPEDLDGRSFLPQLRGQRGEPRDHLYCYYNARPGKQNWPERRWVRDRRYKLYGDGRFFDVVEDPQEQRPLGAETLDERGRARRRELTEALRSWPTTGAALLAPSRPDPAEGGR